MLEASRGIRNAGSDTTWPTTTVEDGILFEEVTALLPLPRRGEAGEVFSEAWHRVLLGRVRGTVALRRRSGPGLPVSTGSHGGDSPPLMDGCYEHP